MTLYEPSTSGVGQSSDPGDFSGYGVLTMEGQLQSQSSLGRFTG